MLVANKQILKTLNFSLARTMLMLIKSKQHNLIPTCIQFLGSAKINASNQVIPTTLLASQRIYTIPTSNLVKILF